MGGHSQLAITINSILNYMYFVNLYKQIRSSLFCYIYTYIYDMIYHQQNICFDISATSITLYRFDEISPKQLT